MARRKPDGNSSTLRNLVILAALIGGGFYIYKKAEANELIEQTRANLPNMVEAKVVSKNTGLLGLGLEGVHDIIVEVKNSSQFNLDKVVLRVEYHTLDGELYATEEVIADNVNSFSSDRVEAPGKERGINVQAYVERVEDDELGMVQF